VGWPTSAEEIRRFVARLHVICKWTPECLVISLLLLIRYHACAPDVLIHARNWHRLVLTASMIAQKCDARSPPQVLCARIARWLRSTLPPLPCAFGRWEDLSHASWTYFAFIM
jgi:hypothetical protein